MSNPVRAFVQLNASGKVIPGTLTYCYVKPKVGSWKEVELRNTISTNKMKPFVNTYNGKPVPGSLVLTYRKPTPLGNKYREVCQEPASCNIATSYWYLRETFTPAINPGDITLPDFATSTGSLNPNLVGDYNGSTFVMLYINVFDIEGVDRTDLLGQLVGGIGTLTLTQGANSVTYSYTEQAFYYATITTPNDNVAFDPFTQPSQFGSLTVTSPASGDFNLIDSIQITVVPQVWYEITECYTTNVLNTTAYLTGTYSLNERVTTIDFGGNWIITDISLINPGGSQYNISSLSVIGCPTTTTTTSTTSTTTTTTTTTFAPPPPPSPGTLRFYVNYTPEAATLGCGIFGPSNFNLTFSAYSINDFVNPIYTLTQTGASGYFLAPSTPGYVPFTTPGYYYYDMTISNLAIIDAITWSTLQNIFDVDFSQLTSATNFITFPGLSLPAQGIGEETINELLALFVSFGNLNNYLLLAGNGAPTGQGLIDKSTLISRGWTVQTN